MDIFHTIIRPLVTEKSNKLGQSSSKTHGPTYVFEVMGSASKGQIRDAIQKIYNVDVVDVRTQIRKGKVRRFRQHVGKVSHTKKAIVVVAANSAIDLF
jgi:large subunit ribosomal protein L23